MPPHSTNTLVKHMSVDFCCLNIAVPEQLLIGRRAVIWQHYFKRCGLPSRIAIAGFVALVVMS